MFGPNTFQDIRSSETRLDALWVAPILDNREGTFDAGNLRHVCVFANDDGTAGISGSDDAVTLVGKTLADITFNNFAGT